MLTAESCELRKTQTGVGRPLVDAGTSVLAGSGLTAVWDFMDKDNADGDQTRCSNHFLLTRKSSTSTQSSPQMMELLTFSLRLSLTILQRIWVLQTWAKPSRPVNYYRTEQRPHYTFPAKVSSTCMQLVESARFLDIVVSSYFAI